MKSKDDNDFDFLLFAVLRQLDQHSKPGTLGKASTSSNMLCFLQFLFFAGALSQNPRRLLAKQTKEAKEGKWPKEAKRSDRTDGSDYCDSCCYFKKIFSTFNSSPDELEKKVEKVIREHHAEDAVKRLTDATTDDGWQALTGWNEITANTVMFAITVTNSELPQCQEFRLSAREVITRWTQKHNIVCPDTHKVSEQATVVQAMSKFTYNGDGKIQFADEFLDTGGLDTGFEQACS
eukprot:g11084.t1